MKNKLTIKQKKFADEYIISGNATESYKVAGYKYSSDNVAAVEGKKLLRNPKVSTYLNERMKELEDKSIAKQDEVLKYLTRVLRGEEKDEALTAVGDVVQLKVSNKDRIKAAELFGKFYGTWSEKIDVNLEMPTIISGSDELHD